jgi:hypothetical protein
MAVVGDIQEVSAGLPGGVVMVAEKGGLERKFPSEGSA